MRKNYRKLAATHGAALLIAGLSQLVFPSVIAQVPQNVTAREINVPYFEGTQLKAFFTGKDAKPITGGKGELLVSDFQMTWFGKTTNEIERVGKAPQCFFN